jgi:N-acetylmuramoyl-L-alanine amidase
VLNAWSVVRLSAVVLFLAGCQAPQSSNPEVGTESPFISEFPPPAPKGPVPDTNVVKVAPLQTNALPAAPSPAPAPKLDLPKPISISGWIPWEHWGATNLWSKPQRLRNLSTLTFALTNCAGTLEMTAGNRTALWNGLALELGFAPRFTNGQLLLHGLDVVKTLEPLVYHSALLQKPNRTVVIDPGHGGENFGAKSILCNRYEKEFTLDWAFRLEPLLEKAGWHVILTRTIDTDLPLADRVLLADKAQADLFVSLHFNSTDQPQGGSDHGGLETYCLTPVGMPSTLTRHFEDELNHSYTNNAFDADNFFIAARVHRALVDGTQRKDRGVRRARFMGVLRGQNRPAVLIEGGYLTYPSEARLIATAEYRQKLAEAVAKSLAPE